MPFEQFDFVVDAFDHSGGEGIIEVVQDTGTMRSQGAGVQNPPGIRSSNTGSQSHQTHDILDSWTSIPSLLKVLLKGNSIRCPLLFLHLSSSGMINRMNQFL